MPLAIAFYVLMLIWLAFGYINRPTPQPAFWWGGTLMEFLLFMILGWAIFGAPIK